ncbi:hypothetical protein PYH37_000071 [Sinorhizobium numidicum]|uniref:Uncharacterized protein n=1 Tax=Sinorhizobium numidicum TaxID=680248 RepID=A0ABY8CSB2_9HYPH|nr:hypothetical protein [Sinorhizobium numidicum]WEX74794.1 hypothetical protein PYH37_000071 [Sinorhizobium numidicum]WEX80787.1 hypothetical protein PYH38_000073 [Sinorhizobium numidicum]
MHPQTNSRAAEFLVEASHEPVDAAREAAGHMKMVFEPVAVVPS